MGFSTLPLNGLNLPIENDNIIFYLFIGMIDVVQKNNLSLTA